MNDIYDHACVQVAVTPESNTSKFVITQAVAQLSSLLEAVDNAQKKMTRLAEMLPAHEVVLSMRGVGKVLAPQLTAEIGGVTRFHSKRALVAFAGLDFPPYQPGQIEAKERKITKRGSPHLRRSLFSVVSMPMLNQPAEDEVFQFMCKKRAEGKRYYVYMTAAANKFLRLYYGQVRECLSVQSELSGEGIAPPAAWSHRRPGYYIGGGTPNRLTHQAC